MSTQVVGDSWPLIDSPSEPQRAERGEVPQRKLSGAGERESDIRDSALGVHGLGGMVLEAPSGTGMEEDSEVSRQRDGWGRHVRRP